MAKGIYRILGHSYGARNPGNRVTERHCIDCKSFILIYHTHKLPEITLRSKTLKYIQKTEKRISKKSEGGKKHL